MSTQKLLGHRDIKGDAPSYIEHNVEMLKLRGERLTKQGVSEKIRPGFINKSRVRPFCSCRQRPASLYNVLIVVGLRLSQSFLVRKAGLKYQNKSMIKTNNKTQQWNMPPFVPHCFLTNLFSAHQQIGKLNNLQSAKFGSVSSTDQTSSSFIHIKNFRKNCSHCSPFDFSFSFSVIGGE